MRAKLILTTGLLAAQLLVVPSLALAVDDPVAPAAPATTVAAARPACVEGQNGVICPTDLGSNVGPGFIVGIINTIANWMFTILLALAVVFIVWAAFNYLTGQGEAEKVTAAHRALIYAAVAIIVAMLSRGFVYVVRNVVDGARNPASSSQGGTTAPSANNGGFGGSGSSSSGSQQARFAAVSEFTKFGVRVEVCTDNKIPGVVIRDDNTPPGTTVNEGFDANVGNPDISASVNGAPRVLVPATEQTLATPAAANAGAFTLVGTVSTGGIIGIGSTDYTFTVEICNQGNVPAIQYNRGTGSNDWRAL